MIGREQFYYLFVHANSLAELGLRFAASEMEHGLELDEQDPAEGESPDVAPSFDDLDFDALPDLDSLGAESEPKPLDSFGPPTDHDEQPDVDSEAFDPDRYLEQAYAHRERLRNRIDTAFGKADQESLRGLLDRLPVALPPLTGRLRGEELDRWLALYKAGDEAVSEIVLRIRQLES